MTMSDDTAGYLRRKVEEIDKMESSCRAEILQRIENHNHRLESQATDIQRLYNGAADIKATVDRGIGIMIAVESLFVFGVIIVEKLWK
jgi:hypothetical protein